MVSLTQVTATLHLRLVARSNKRGQLGGYHSCLDEEENWSSEVSSLNASYPPLIARLDAPSAFYHWPGTESSRRSLSRQPACCRQAPEESATNDAQHARNNFGAKVSIFSHASTALKHTNLSLRNFQNKLTTILTYSPSSVETSRRQTDFQPQRAF